ncbi:MAG: hypothetical protein LBK76_05545 [Verrucomicrobiales bacterium]|jgi:hypothetical protein|nr:hypothetical protein [Verrucomicrobiales bacterium]
MNSDEKAREELKRWQVMTPRRRWQAIRQAIEFAEQNLPPEQRRNRPRHAPYARSLPLTT